MITFRYPLTLLALALGTVAASSSSAASLDAVGDLAVLVGGTQGSYHQTIDPATLTDVASGNNSISLTQGPLSATSASSSSAKFGLLTETSTLTATGTGSYGYTSEGLPTATARDVITVHGTGAITMTLFTFLQGGTSSTVSPNVGTHVHQDVYLGPAGFVNDAEASYLTDDDYNNAVFGSLQSHTVTVSDGQSFYLFSHLVQGSNASPQQNVTLTASTSSSLFYWVTLSSGATLSSDSNALYLAPAAVPEPTSLAALAVGGLALVRRRRRK